MTRNVLTATQVATRLGVQRATVYAYVSRGLLRRSVGDDGRTSWFDPDEVDELARRGRPRAREERTGAVDVVLASGLTQIVDGGLRYRGHDVAALAADQPFEAVAELLWTGALPDPPPRAWSAPDEAVAAAEAATRALPAAAPVAARLATAVAALAAGDEARGDLRPDTVHRKARTVLTVFARTPLPVGDPAAEGPRRVARLLWPRISPRRATAARLAALDRTLVCLADHELATSTLAARVAASTRANPFACVLAAIGAFSGPLHGRAAVAVHRMLVEAATTGDPATALDGVLAGGGGVPGFGHGLYPAGDPRAAVVLEGVAGIASPTALATIDAVRRIAGDAAGAEPNVDFALGALALAGSMPLGATEGVFAVARTAGWVAHVLEEYDERPLRYRARAIYTGAEAPGRG